MNNNKYFGMPNELSGDSAKIAILPVPFEATVSYGGGTAKGPSAILEASKQVEWYDDELDSEPCDVGIATEDAVSVDGTQAQVMERIESKVALITESGRLPLVLGGEHSITPAAVNGVARIKGNKITVVQFDAHADLRQEYQGNAHSHACAMARIRERFPAVQVGIRSLSAPEAQWIEREDLPVFFASQMVKNTGWMEEALASIETEDVYVTIDVDAFDSSLMPSTGTPEPGGMGWYEVTNFIRKIAGKKNIVGFDIVELAPQKSFHAADFLTAKLAYKCIGYWREGRK